VIADSDNSFDPRTTLVYYWPLTREYFESWDKLDEPVDGRLEVLAGSRVVSSADRTEIVLSYAHATAEGASTLFAGPEARRVREAFDAHRAEYERGMELYSRRMLEYRRALRDYMRASSRQPIAAPMPREPAEPQPPDEFVTDPVSAFVVRLPEGTYRLRVIDPAGNVVEGSERRVVAFKPLGVRGTGYEIIPEERWTARIRSEARDAGLFCMPGKDLYVIPYVTESYRQDQLARLRDPQSTETSQHAVQVYTAPREGGRLTARSPGKLDRQAAWTPWYVKQKPGSELGYSIMEWSREAAGADSPAFAGFRLSFADEDAGSAWRLTLDTGGGVAAGSARELRVIGPGTARLPWLFALAPVIAGACVLIWRKRKG